MIKRFTLISTFLFTLLTPSSVLAATLSLSPSSGTFNKSCPFSLEIIVDTQDAETDGTDAILIYDSTRFTANSNSITQGTIYAAYPGNNICENDNNLSPGIGKVTISGLASVSSAFSGKGTLAKITFTVKESAPTGATQVKFDFDINDKSKTTDSNVVQRGTIADVLNSVVNGNYTIGTGTCVSSSATPGTGAKGAVGPGSAATLSAQPKTIDQFVDQTGKGPGTPELTFTLAILGSVLTVLGILGLALL